MLSSAWRLLTSILFTLPVQAGVLEAKILPLDPIGGFPSTVVAPLGVAYKPDAEGAAGGSLFVGHFGLIQEFTVLPKGKNGFKLGGENQAFTIQFGRRASGVEARTIGSLLVSFNNEVTASVGEFLDFGFSVNPPTGIQLGTCDPNDPANGLIPCIVEHPEGVAFDDERDQLWVAGEPASIQKGRLVVYDGGGFIGTRPVHAIFSTPCPAEPLARDPVGVPVLCITAADPFDPPLNDPSGIDIDPATGRLLVVQDGNAGPGAIFEIAVGYDAGGLPVSAQVLAVQELNDPASGLGVDPESISFGAGDLAGLVFVGLEDEETVAVFARGEPGQSREQQKCIQSAQKSVAGVGKAAWKDLQACLKTASRGAPVPDCLDAAVGGLAKAVAKADAALDKSCAGVVPDFGADPETLIDAATDGPTELAGALFGPDVAAVAADASTDPDGARCQADLVKSVAKLYGTDWKTAAKAVKVALTGKFRAEGSGPVDSAEQLAAELFAALEADSQSERGKIAKSLAQLPAKLGSCDSAISGLAQLFPSECAASADAASFGQCAGQVTQCSFCRTLEATSALSLDCESLDDGASNGSCPAP